MSALFDLLLWVSPEQCEEAFCRLVLRLMTATGNEKLGIGRIEVPADGAEEQLRSVIETQARNRYGLIDTGMMYRLVDGHEVLLGFTLRTSRDNRLENNIHGWMIFSALMHSYSERFPGAHYLNSKVSFRVLDDPPVGLPAEELWYTAWQVSQNFEQVLLLAIDAVAADFSIRHAALRWEESSWDCALYARMMYHLDITEFAKDLLRLYLEVRWPASWPHTSTFEQSPAEVLLELESKGALAADEDMMILGSQDVWIGETPTLREEVIEYFRFLDRERAVRWANTDAATVERALLAAARETSNVSAQRLAGGGWLVSTHAFNNLREFYFALGLLLDGETADARS
jgi:hypothetical protein